MSRKILCITSVLAILALVLPSTAVVADDEKGSWKDMERESKRMKIDEAADAALKAVLSANDKPNDLYASSYGWAAFDNLKLAIGVSGGGGNGVAVKKDDGSRTYMKMGTAGIGFGIGGQKYQVVFLFQDEQTFKQFVESGWQADATASAVAGDEGASAKSGFVNGLAIYQIGEKGLMANADIAGTKYWQNKNLND